MPMPASMSAQKARSPLRQALGPLALSADQQSDARAASAHTPAAAVLVHALGEVFTRHLSRLARHPSFEKLWCGRLMYLLGYYLGAPHGFAHEEVLGAAPTSSAEAGENREGERLRETVVAARETLLRMMRGLVKGGHFKGADRLWNSTQETIAEFRGFAGEWKVLLHEAMTD